jgi:secondary thiamine-phosphate synthase enzyme
VAAPRGTGIIETRFELPRVAALEIVANATLTVDTNGEGLVDITLDAVLFLGKARARDGVFLAYVRHTSASLTIQENADPDVRVDLTTALRRLAPEDAGWVHDVEGPDDMPAHVKAMLTGVSLHVPVVGGKLALGTWQGIYLIEHRARPHTREVILQFVGSRRGE